MTALDVVSWKSSVYRTSTQNIRFDSEAGYTAGGFDSQVLGPWQARLVPALISSGSADRPLVAEG
jgi:hypothetical protein